MAIRTLSNKGSKRWRKDTRGVALYILLPFLVFAALLLALGGATIQSVRTARSTMSRYVQIALQQTADAAVSVYPTTGGEWTATATASRSAATVFATALRAQFVGTPWAQLPVTVQNFQVFTPQEVGQPAPPGYPNPTITAPGYYVRIRFPWRLLVPGAATVPIRVAEVMQANSFSAPNRNWNPAP